MRLVIALFVLLTALAPVAWAACPEDLAATSEYAGVLAGARTQAERDLALTRAKVATLEAQVKTLQTELDKLKPVTTAPAPKAEEKK